MTIRPFELTDTDAVIELWRQCRLVVPWNDPGKDIARKLKVGADLFLVDERDAKIAGSVMGGYEGHRGWINYLAVSPGYQRQGIGRALMAEVQRKLIDLGCPKINLQVRSTNQAVIAFYEALGFADDHALGMGKRLESDQ
jgi:ribosomal protein S18 acetylase RimI-like enzyme